jgi:hypothetical protein
LFGLLAKDYFQIASTMGGSLSELDIRKTTEIVRRLSDDVKRGRSGCRSVPTDRCC